MPRKKQTTKPSKTPTGSSPNVVEVVAKKELKKGELVVISKVEITKADTHKTSLHQYRNNVEDITKRVREFALKQSDNLLTVKMALWGAARDVEKMMKERKE